MRIPVSVIIAISTFSRGHRGAISGLGGISLQSGGSLVILCSAIQPLCEQRVHIGHTYLIAAYVGIDVRQRIPGGRCERLAATRLSEPLGICLDRRIRWVAGNPLVAAHWVAGWNRTSEIEIENVLCARRRDQMCLACPDIQEQM